MSITRISEELERLDKDLESANESQKKIILAEIILMEEELAKALGQV
jgi:hypothetical protein